MRALLRFLVHSNLFIAGCAVLMVNQTCRFLLHVAPDNDYLFFVFFSTICSYSFHWFLTSHSVIPSPRIQWTERNRVFHAILFFTGMAGAAIFFFYLRSWWFWLSLSVVMTFLYSAPKIPHPLFRSLRKIALGKTIFLAMVWMYVTTIIPIIISGQGWEFHHTLFVLSRFFLIYAICILFDYRDREDDKADGVRSLITFLDEKGIFLLFAFSLLVFMVSTTWLLQYNYPLLSVMILLIPGIIIACLYNYARKNFSDLFYYFILDGMMALSAILMLIPGI